MRHIFYFLHRGHITIYYSPGVHWLQDPRSGVYNFTTWLESIPNVKEFAFDRVTGFIKSSSDEVCVFIMTSFVHVD